MNFAERGSSFEAEALKAPQPALLGYEAEPKPDARAQTIRIHTQFTPRFGDWLIRYRVGIVASSYTSGISSSSRRDPPNLRRTRERAA